MENASQALIIAGTILIAMMVLGVGVYLVSNYSRVGESYEETRITAEIAKFNTNFTKFINRTDITAQEIITLKNFAQNYDTNNGTKTTVEYLGSGKKDIEFITDNFTTDGSMKYFKCIESYINYDSEGRVISIYFKR